LGGVKVGNTGLVIAILLAPALPLLGLLLLLGAERLEHTLDH